jgi:hypothetical protein
LKIADVCWRLEEDVNVLPARRVRDVGLAIQLLCTIEDGIPGTRKSRTGSGVLCRYLRGVSMRNAPAADDEVEALSCEQLLVIHRVAMADGQRGYVNAEEV